MKQTITLTKNTRIAVLYGGLSSEREVSLRSGKNCFDALQRLGYQNAFLLDVDKDIAHRLSEEKPELAYIALHGTYGEDGCVQGLLELMGIPYTGNDVAASALTWNKALTKTILKEAGLPVLPSVQVDMTEKQGQLCAVSGLNYPVMVKPLAEGSSYGMSKVDDASHLQKALKEASEFGKQVMVEEYLQGKSITVGVIDINGEATVTPILEMRPVDSDWYDLEAKYTPGKTQFILPAEIPADVTQKIQQDTLKAHKAAGCSGVSRIDYVVCPKNWRYYVLEINTIPGMTDLSDLPAQAKCMGIEYDQLVELILKSALPKAIKTPA